MWNDKFLEGLKYRNLQLAISEKEFRANMCEALCTMFIAKKQNKEWRGPVSEMPRPEDWTYTHEMEWMDVLRSKYLTYDFFDSFGAYFDQKAIWENAVSDWRTSFEIIALHYVAVDPNLLAEGDSDMDYTPAYDVEDSM
jgi:hypothetical protein